MRAGTGRSGLATKGIWDVFFRDPFSENRHDLMPASGAAAPSRKIRGRFSCQPKKLKVPLNVTNGGWSSRAYRVRPSHSPSAAACPAPAGSPSMRSRFEDRGMTTSAFVQRPPQRHRGGRHAAPRRQPPLPAPLTPGWSRAPSSATASPARSTPRTATRAPCKRRARPGPRRRRRSCAAPPPAAPRRHARGAPQLAGVGCSPDGARSPAACSASKGKASCPATCPPALCRTGSPSTAGSAAGTGPDSPRAGHPATPGTAALSRRSPGAAGAASR